MRLLIVKSVIILTTIFAFSGCAKKTEPVDPSQYTNYKILYEVAYDHVCKGSFGKSYSFKKGDRFIPYDAGNSDVFIAGGGTYKIPENSIGLLVHTLPFNDKIYVLIYPDGTFAAKNYHFIQESSSRTGYYHADTSVLCSQKNQPLFKSIKTEDLK